VKQKERAVPSARLPFSVDHTIAIPDMRHDVRNKSPLRVQFKKDFLVLIKTGVKAPNTNSIMERLSRTVRQVVLDNLLLIGRSQTQRILEEHIALYNSQRPHR
jgi:hypothetical protein